jgi:hypothetical protein
VHRNSLSNTFQVGDLVLPRYPMISIAWPVEQGKLVVGVVVDTKNNSFDFCICSVFVNLLTLDYLAIDLMKANQ